MLINFVAATNDANHYTKPPPSYLIKGTPLARTALKTASHLSTAYLSFSTFQTPSEFILLHENIVYKIHENFTHFNSRILNSRNIESRRNYFARELICLHNLGPTISNT